MMRDWKKSQVAPDTPILEALRIIDAGSLQIALVTDAGNRLLAVVTDGDIRRGLLKGISLDLPVHLIMNRTFTSVTHGTPHGDILHLMNQKDLRHIPVLDDEGRVLDLKVLDELVKRSPRDNWVVLMAGGLGKRLMPLTNNCPKPMLRVGNKPLLETILENFIEFGYHRFFLSVNYKAEMIEAHFGDGSAWGVTIDYLREEQPLGTAGALGLLPETPSLPFIVMNGDVLTKINLQHLLDFHQTYRTQATMCVREYHFQVPYGVIQTDQHRLKVINEKPVHRFFVNAGIYVLEPQVLDLVPENDYLDMPALFQGLMARGQETIVFPIREYWMDIGRLDDFERANGEYPEVFG